MAAGTDQTLLLEIVVNGYPSGKIGEFILRDSALFARRAELTDIGFRVPSSLAETQDGLIALSSLPGIKMRLDQPSQTLVVTAGNDRLLPTLLAAGIPPSSTGQVESGTGLSLDYDVLGTSISGQTTASGLFELRAFSPWGVMSSGMLGYAGSGPDGPGTNAAIRLDSTYVYSDPDTLRRYRLGDYINGGLNWTRPVRLGGVQVIADFSMRPDLITFPLPSVSGSVAVPSTVDVIVNGAQLLSRDVQPGPFQIPQLPVVTGAGTVAMTVRDALGRQVSTTLPFYASSNLLAPDLQSYSVEFGAVRRNWGVISNDYGNWAGSATYRRGITSDLTLEAHIEGTNGQVMAGGGAVANLFDLGVVSVAAAASSSRGRTGTQFAIGAQRIDQVLSLGASVAFADHNFRDIAAMNGDPVPRQQISVSAGLSLGRFGSVGVAYVGIDRDMISAPIRFVVPAGTVTTPTATAVTGGTVLINRNVGFFVPAQHTHVLSASYSVQLWNAAAYATGFHDFASGGSSGVLFGLTIPLGSRSSFNASAGGGGGAGSTYAQAQVAQTPVTVGDWGYQAYASAGNTNHAFAQVQYKSPWGLGTLGVDRLDRQTSLRAEAQGALSYIDGGLYASNSINDSFAVVDTGGTEGIRVYSENREAGRTDSAGRLLLTDLRSFDVNRIGIEPTDIPADVSVPSTTREVRPQDRSGVVVRFPIKTSRGALLRLTDEGGIPIRTGSSATLEATGAAVPIGYDGEAFVEDLSPHDNRLRVQRPDGRRCTVVFDYHAVPGEIPVIGPLRCR